MPAVGCPHLGVQGWSKQRYTYDFKDGSTFKCYARCTDVLDFVYEPTLFDPVTRKWSEKGSLEEMMRPRLYHSTAVLLPTCEVSGGQSVG